MKSDQTRDPLVDQFLSALGSAENAYRQMQDARDQLDSIRVDLAGALEDLAILDELDDREAARIKSAIERGNFQEARDDLHDALEEGEAA